VSQGSPPEETPLSIPSPSTTDTHLSGLPLLLARGVWVTLMLLFCGVYLAAVLVYALQLHGFQQGVYAHLIAQPVVVSGFDAFASPLYLLLFSSSFTQLILTLLSPCWFAVSLLIFWRRSDDWMALFVSLLLVMVAINFLPALSALSYEAGFASLLGVCLTLLHLLTWSSVAFFFALFPDGRFVPGWTRWLVAFYLVWQVPFCLPSNAPFFILHWPPLLVISLFLGLVLAFGFAQLYRYRRVSTTIQRQQTKWIVFGMLVGTLLDLATLLSLLVFPTLAQSITTQALYMLLGEITTPVVFLLIPITVGVAILRYRLWNIDLLIHRTLVYGLLSASVIGLYLLVVVGLGTLFSALGNLLLSLLATGLIAVLVHPLHQRLQRAVNHLMFGERDDPYGVLARLGSRLEATLATDSLLPTIVETVAQALKLPYVAITSRQQGDDVLAASSSEARTQETLVCVPLVVHSEQVGDLWLAARAPGDSLTPADLRLLHDLAPQVAVAVQAVQLTAELKQLTADLLQARTRLVTAREEERRRLRRDLHDGLGPTLASLTFKIDAARNLLTRDSERADRLLADVRQQAQEAITDIRRLVYDLRPPALDELGLLSALREQATSSQHQGLQITVDAPESLPLLPAAVEVAAYRIAQEALTNVVRHAGAQQCLLCLRQRDQVLTLQITDDGKGIVPGHHIGVGLLAMQERAVELGGRCTITISPSGGTTIQASLPLGMAEDSSPASPPGKVL
jgi:signal transduction histidine kinase